MKRQTLLCSVSALLGTAGVLLAQNPAPVADPLKEPGTLQELTPPPEADDNGTCELPRPLNCTAVLEIYAMPKDEALALLEGASGERARYAAVLALAGAGKARLETLTALPDKTGQRAAMQASDEVRYPVEFAPPAGKSALAAPLVYEVQEAGDTLEIEPVTGPDGHTWDVNLVPVRRRLAGFRDIPGMAGDASIGQPVFTVEKTKTMTEVKAGSPCFLGTLTPTASDGAASGTEARLAFLTLHARAEARKSKVEIPLVAPVSMNIEFSFYSLDRMVARGIVAALPEFGAPWAKMQGLTGEKKARFEHLLSVKSRSGLRSMTEETLELRQADSYLAAGAVRVQKGAPSAGGSQPPGAKEEAAGAKEHAESTAKSREMGAGARVTASGVPLPGMPDGLVQRNAGLSAEVEPVIYPDGGAVDLDFVLSSVTELGTLKASGVSALYPAQPVYEVRKITSDYQVRVGEHVLLGTFNPPGANGVNERADDGRAWLVFVRVLRDEP